MPEDSPLGGHCSQNSLGPTIFQVIWNVQNSNGLALLANVTGWPCQLSNMSAICDQDWTISQTICPGGLPPSPPSPPSPPPLRPPPFPPGGPKCTLSYTAQTCDFIPSTSGFSALWDACVGSAQILNLLYISGVQMSPQFYCNFTTQTSMRVQATTVTAYDNVLFWRSFGSSPMKLIPVMTRTGVSASDNDKLTMTNCR